MRRLSIALHCSFALACAGVFSCGSGSDSGGGTAGSTLGGGAGVAGSGATGGAPGSSGGGGNAGGTGGAMGTGGTAGSTGSGGGAAGSGGGGAAGRDAGGGTGGSTTGSGGGNASGSGGAGGTTADAGTRPRDAGRADATADAARIIGAGDGGNITIWIAGDSTVATGSAPCPIGWGGQFKPHFDNRLTVVNSAVAGRSVRNWLYSVEPSADATGECIIDMVNGQPVMQQRWIDMLYGMKPGDYLFIQFGINDGDPTCADARHVGIDAFKQHYGYMAQSAKDRGAQPVFLTPVSAIRCTGTTAVGTRGAYVPATIDAGTQYGVPVIELHALSIALYNSLTFCPLPGGTDVSATTGGAVGAFFCDDHTHFETAGAMQVGNLVANAVRTQQLGLAAYLQ
jgi:lysophospholipase L1-like esterase